MNARLKRVLEETENNIYSGVGLLNGAIVFVWTLLCLFLINKNKSFLFASAFGGAYYLSLVVLCILLFKGIIKYLSFPKENRKMPVFIGHKLDTIFIYPVLLMAIIGIASNLLTATGFFSTATQQMGAAGIATIEMITKFMLLPLIAFAEELLNLLLVSFVYKHMKLPGIYRLLGSILSAALIFGILHTFGWGLNAAIPIGIAYIPVFFATLYTGNIWISFLAHLYNDLISIAKYYNSSFHLIIIAVITLIPAVWAIRTMLRKTR
ncbi:MAG: CPBP family glutamic-type intramembrane protease [Clostridia bacterium]